MLDHESSTRRTASWEWLKTLIPWIVTAAIFLWQTGGTWSATAGDVAAANKKVEALELELKASYVTKDAFRAVAEDVRDIKQLLMQRKAQDRQ